MNTLITLLFCIVIVSCSTSHNESMDRYRGEDYSDILNVNRATVYLPDQHKSLKSLEGNLNCERIVHYYEYSREYLDNGQMGYSYNVFPISKNKHPVGVNSRYRPYGLALDIPIGHSSAAVKLRSYVSYRGKKVSNYMRSELGESFTVEFLEGSKRFYKLTGKQNYFANFLDVFKKIKDNKQPNGGYHISLEYLLTGTKKWCRVHIPILETKRY